MDTYYDIVKSVIESTGVDYVENDKSVWLDGLDFAVPSRKLAIKINRVSIENNDVTATVPIRERGYHKKMHDTVEKAGWELLSLDDRQLVDYELVEHHETVHSDENRRNSRACDLWA